MPKTQEVAIRFGCFIVNGDEKTAESRLTHFLEVKFNERFSSHGISISMPGFERIPPQTDDVRPSFIPNNLWFDVVSNCQESAVNQIRETLGSTEFKSFASEYDIELDWFDFE